MPKTDALHPLFLLGGVMMLVVAVHGWVLIMYRRWTMFGYDYGFYRRYVIEPFTSIPHASVPGLDHTVILPRIILDSFRLLGLPTDITLVIAYWGVILFFLVMFGLWVRTLFSTRVALLSIVVIVLSPLYYYTYWSFLFKNFLAFGLLFGILYAIQRRSWSVMVACAVLLPVTHQSTTILAGLILFGFTVLLWSRREPWSMPIAGWGILLTLYLVYHPTVASKIAAPPVAAFLTNGQATMMLLPVLIIAVWSIWMHGKKIFLHHSDLLVMATVALAFPLLGLPFHERVYPLLLISLSVLSGYAISRVSVVWKVTLLFLLVVWYVLVARVMIVPDTQTHDLIRDSRIENLADGVSLVSPNHLAPWLHGYTTAKVFAPGLFKDPFLPQDWEYYWSATDTSYNRDFLRSFPEPLYIFAPAGQEYFLPEANCREQVSPVLYRYTCYE